MCVIFAHHLLLDYALICTKFGRFLDEFDYGVCVYKRFERVNLWYRVYPSIHPSLLAQSWRNNNTIKYSTNQMMNRTTRTVYSSCP